MRQPSIVLATAAVIGVLGCGSSKTTAPSPVTYIATMTPAADRNADGTQTAINSTATGTATLVLTGDTLAYTVTANGLSSVAIASHIHAAPPTLPGPVVNGFVINQGITTGTVASGKIALSTLVPAAGQVSGDSLRTLLNNGNAYVNVHTSNYHGGEIRGQVAKQ